MYTPPVIIQKVGEQIRKPLPGAGEDLEAVIRELDVARVDLAFAAAEQQRLLYEKRKQYLWPKDADKNITELDRTTRLNGDLAPLESDYRLMTDMQNMLEQKITLAILFMR